MNRFYVVLLCVSTAQLVNSSNPNISVFPSVTVWYGHTVLNINPTINRGRPEASVTWLHNNVILDPAKDSRVSINYNTGSLSISDVTGDDRGFYTIKLMNGLVTVSETVNVTIYFLELLTPMVIRYGDNITMRCVMLAGGFYSPEVYWIPGIQAHTVYETDQFEYYKVTTEASVSASNCSSSQLTYTCHGRIYKFAHISSVAITPCAAIPVMVDVINSTAVRATWDGRPHWTYRIRYTRDNPQITMVTPHIVAGTVDIGGLTANKSYTFELIINPNSSIRYSTFTTSTLPPSNSTLPPSISDMFFPNWAIAVTVVGALAVLIGLAVIYIGIWCVYTSIKSNQFTKDRSTDLNEQTDMFKEMETDKDAHA